MNEFDHRTLEERIKLLEDLWLQERRYRKRGIQERRWLALALTAVAIVAIAAKIEIDLGWLRASTGELSQIIEALNQLQNMGLLAVLLGGGAAIAYRNQQDEDESG